MNDIEFLLRITENEKVFNALSPEIQQIIIGKIAEYTTELVNNMMDKGINKSDDSIVLNDLMDEAGGLRIK